MIFSSEGWEWRTSQRSTRKARFTLPSSQSNWSSGKLDEKTTRTKQHDYNWTRGWNENEIYGGV